MRTGVAEDFPPRIKFENVRATKADTDEVLTRLDDEAANDETLGSTTAQ